MSGRRRVSVAALAALLLAASPWGRSATHAAAAAPDWKEVDRLVAAQQLDAAVAEVDKILAAAEKAGDETSWARALIRETQLRTQLGDYETAVRQLRDRSWPKGTLAHAALRLYLAATLVNYNDVNAWEIGQRERVATTATADLKAWTRDQIFAAATAAYVEIWKARDDLGSEPVARFGEYLTANNYPADVRGTLRDAVAYLFVELLANTQGWRPEQASEIYALDLPALIRGDVTRSRALHLDDPAVHPLLKIGAVLDDLEAWHLQRKERDAALEARLTRMRTLHEQVSEETDRSAVTQALEKSLPSFQDRPWWAMGQGTLAGFVERAGDAARARALAQAGAKAYPRTPGGELCRAIVARIEAPSYELTAMAADGLRRRSLQVTHQHLSALYLRAYAVDLEHQIASSRDYELLPGESQWKQLLAGNARPAAEWTVTLAPGPDFKTHVTYVTPPLAKLGLYVIVASARPGFGASDNLVKAVNFVATDLVLLSRQEGAGKIEAQVLDGDTGKPVPGAEVLLERSAGRDGHVVEATQKTDAQGLARFSPSPQRLYSLLARRAGSHAVLASLQNWWRQPNSVETTRALVYTDRSIYRPLQKLYFKAIAFKGRTETARYNVVPGVPVTVVLRDPNGEEVARTTSKSNAYGSVAGELAIPAGRMLGRWSVVAEGYGSASVRVEEYKRPTFEVKLEDAKSALRLNSPAAIQGEARYYFGLPVTSGQVRWRVTREPVFPFWFWWGRSWGSSVPSAQTVGAGSATLDAQGHFRFTFVPAADPRVAAHGVEVGEVSYRYRVVADVTEEGGETRSAERGFRLGYVAVEATVKQDSAFFREGERAGMQVLRADLDGVPRPGRGAWRLYALAQPSSCALPAEQPATLPSEGAGTGFHTPGDAQRPRWDTGVSREEILRGWSNGAQQASGALVHDARGEAKVALPALAPGAYRLVYETDDDFGAHYRTGKEFFVVGTAGRATPLALPATLVVENSDVRVGGKARVFVASCFPGQPMAVDVWRAGQHVSRRWLTAGSDAAMIELPVGAADRGGFTVSLTALRDHQLSTATADVRVPWDDRELQVELSTFRDKIRPGARETWKVTVKGPPAARPEAAAAELLAYMYDRSLDLFAPHTPPSPMDLWPTRTGAPEVQKSLDQTSALAVVPPEWKPIPMIPELRGDVLKLPQAGNGLTFNHGVGGGYGRGGLGIVGGKPGPPMAAPAPKVAGIMKREAAPEQQARLRGDSDLRENDKAAQPAGAAPPPGTAVPLRGNFAETAFWRPQLLAGADGTASIEFTVPDSVTSWNVWVHALSKTLRSGSLHKQTQSIKDLMVRPSVPRFLREGDRAELQVVVNNASARDLTGELRFVLADPDTGQDLAREFGLSARDLTRPFKVGKGGGTHVTFALVAPRQVRLASIRVTAVADGLSDGELRPLPVLPSRVHLAQSRFVSLHDKDRRELTFKDLTTRDDTRINDQLVVTVDAQLFYTVLQALPYLVTYPYECAEQTLNRFLSASIVGSVFRDYPAVAALATKLSRRETPLETFDAADPNRRMALEESPWLTAARGDPLEKGSKSVLVNVLDPRVAAAERAASLAKLRKLQTPAGAFPWFPGGPPDPYMTLYIMSGLARAAEFKVDVPKDVVQRGWQYLAAHFRAQYSGKLIKRDCCWDWLTFLDYVASSYPDASWVGGALSAEERAQILDFSFAHWKQHSGYLKGLLALTLKRAGRAADARLVWASVMDAARTRPDEGTFWAREDRSWLWYNDSIETHAFALRTLMELSPDDPRKDGLVLWLLLNKKLNQWKSTRATAEVIYALVHYLKREKALGVREAVKVTAAGKTTELVFAPDVYTGKASQIVIPGPELGARTATVTVEKESKGFAFASATWHFSTEQLPAEERGDFFSVTRHYFRRDGGGKQITLVPLAEGALLKPGDEIEVQLSLRAKQAAEYVHLRDPRGAGFEPENAASRHRWDLGIVWYEETRDSGADFFFEQLPAGQYTFKYRLRANMSGTFRVGPATVQSMYAPEFNAYSAGATLTVAPGGSGQP